MKHKHEMLGLAFACLGLGAGAVAPLEGTPAWPGASGWLERAYTLEQTSLPQGAVDQLVEAWPLPAAYTGEDTRWLHCRALWQAGRTDEACRALELFIARNGASPRRFEAMALLGDASLARHDFAAALKAYGRIPADALGGDGADRLRCNRAVALMMLGERAQAANLLRRVGPSSPMRNQATFYLGCIAYADKDWVQAEKLFSRVDPAAGGPCADAPFYLMETAFAQADYAAALSDARALLAATPAPQGERLAECLRVGGESAWLTGNRQEAAAMLWDYLSRIDIDAEGPHAANACYMLGVDEYAAGNLTEAVKLLQRAVGSADGPTMQSAYLYLGQAYRSRGDNDAALMAFGQAVINNYDRTVEETARYNSITTRLDGGRVPFGNGLAMMEEFLEEFPASTHRAKVERYLVDGYLNGNDHERALALIDKSPRPLSQELQKARARALFMLGSAELASGGVSKARSLLDEAAASPAADASVRNQALLWLGEARWRGGDIKGAADAFARFVQADTHESAHNTAYALYGLGYAKAALGDNADAAQAMAKALKALPADADAAWRADIDNRRGDALLLGGNTAEALKAFKAAESANPDAADYPLYRQATVAGLQRRHADKVMLLNTLLARYPSTPLAPQALLEKAETLLALNRSGEAVSAYDELIANYPATPAARNGQLQKALALLSAGKTKEADQAYRQVIALYPTSPEATLALDDLKRLHASQGSLPELQQWLAGIDGAPAMQPDEMEQLSFEAAESSLLRDADAKPLQRHVTNYPKGRNTALALCLLSEQAWDEGRAQEAASLAQRSLDLAPDGGSQAERALLVKARAEASLGKWNAARATYTTLEGKASDAAMLREARLGHLRAADALKLNDEAERLASTLLTSSTGSPADEREVSLMQARAQLRQGRHAEAESTLRRLSRQPASPEGAEAAVLLIGSLSDTGRKAEAKQEADKFIDANPPQPYWLARAFIAYSDLLRAEGSTFEADEYLRSLRANYPGQEADIRTMIDQRLSK